MTVLKMFLWAVGIVVGFAICALVWVTFFRKKGGGGSKEYINKKIDSDTTTLTVDVNSKDPKIYLAGPMFTAGQRFENAMIASSLHEKGFTNIFLPQQAGIDDMIGLPFFLAGISPFDNLDAETKAKWGNNVWPIIYCLDLYELATSDIVVFNANGTDPDSGALTEVGLGSAMGKITMIYFTEYDKVLNPMNMGITGTMDIPSAATFNEVPDILQQVIDKRKKSSQAVYEYTIAPNLLDYVILGQKIKNVVDKMDKQNLKSNFEELVELCTTGEGGKLLGDIQFNPTGVSSTFVPDSIEVSSNGITSKTFDCTRK